jgi:hypothetical protein
MTEFVAAVPAVVVPQDAQEDDGKSPVVTIHREKGSLRRLGPTDASVVLWKNAIRKFLLDSLFADNECLDIKNVNRPSKCRCLQPIGPIFSEIEAVAVVEYLYGYALLHKSEQQTLLVEWMKYSDTISHAFARGDTRKKETYLLPGTIHLVCRNAIARFLGVGKSAWNTMSTMAKKNLPPSHGLVGEPGNSYDPDMEELLGDYFKDVLKFGTPRATLVIRNLVRGQVVTALREDDEEIIELPSHMSKRFLYNRLLLQIGWSYTYDSQSRIVDRLPVEGMEQQKAPSWGSFRRYWAKHYPKLYIAGAREDVCNQCYVFANRHRFSSKKKPTVDEETQDDEQEDIGPPPEDEDDEKDEDDEAALMVDGEELIKVAARHVEMAQQQRAIYQRKRQEAIDTLSLSPKDRVLCYVADYAQNMYIPNFASEQPGATYYYSPLSCYVFGVVDASKDKLSAWMYTEATAKKGGNNVASLLIHHLAHHGIIADAEATGEPFKELNFIMDNCGGQNKNRHVLRLLHFIVKRRIAVIARAIFLVRGHTKNACDRLFNTMKKQYRKCNSFTPDDLVESIKGNDKVDPFMVPEDVFKDWDTLENEFIRKPPAGNTNSNHIFTVDINRNNGNSMFIQESDGCEEKELKLVKKQYLLNDAAFWKQQQPQAIAPVGLQDIKWKELYSKWSKYVPEEKKQQWRYYNEAPPKEKIAEVAKQSKEARKQRQQRTRTVHESTAKKPKLDSNTDSKQRRRWYFRCYLML